MHPAQHELQAILDRRIGGIRLLDSHWLSTFEIHHAQVPGYRRGEFCWPATRRTSTARQSDRA